MAINRDKVLEAAQKFVEKKKYDKAVIEYQRLVAADPNDARTLLKIGDLQAKQGLHGDAISTYETVGKLYSQQGFALKAIAVYKQIREIIAKHVPQLEERYGHITPKLADLYQQLGLTSDALAALDEVATRLQRQQRDPEAIEVFRRIVELDPTNPLPHLRLAEALSRVRDVEGAVYEFKTAASQLAGIGRRDDALKVLERLLHHRADPEQARVAAELYLSRGQPQDGMQALSKLQICFQANPRDFDTLSLLARAFNAIGQGAKAIEVQKEMARVARDTGKTDLFREIVERLQRVAPHDDGVRKLASQTGSVAGPLGGGSGSNAAHMPAQPAPPPPPAMQSGAYAGQRETYNAQGQHPGSYPNAAPQQPPPIPARPPTQPMNRPPGAASAWNQPPPPPAPPRPQAQPPVFPETVDEVSYQEVIEDDVEDVSHSGSYEDANAYVAEEESPAYETDVNHDAYAAQQPGYAPEEAAPAEGADIIEKITKVLADANAFRRVRLYNKALEVLRSGLDVEPRSMDIHEVYRDILIESGQTEDAVQEMLVIASLYVDALDGDSAARALQDVLAFDPHNARAIEMLQELGYEIVDENEEQPAGEYAEEIPHDPLPSYDLEEQGVQNLGAPYAPDRRVHVAQEQPSHADPYAQQNAYEYQEEQAYAQQPRDAAGYAAEQAYGAEQGYGAEQAYGAAEPAYGEDNVAELPSFPLDEDQSQDRALGTNPYGRNPPAIAMGPADEEAPRTESPDGPPPQLYVPAASASAAPAAAPSMGPAARRDLEDALDEAEFFCSRGLFDDARAILEEQRLAHPNNPLVRERLAEIDLQEQQRGSGARERPREPEAHQDYDIASSLDALEGLDYGELQPAEGHANQEEQVDVEEVFAKFKEGVAKQISVDDSDSHYNLGIAYKEMLLLDDAIREFELAARDLKRECVCRSMIGMIHIERGNVNEAIEAFLQGLAAQIKDPQQETVLCYEIGAAYEAKKLNKEALSYYQKAMRRDPNYRDVQERVRRLAKNESKTPLRQAAVGADDEFDRAFDDLVSKA